MTVLTIDVLREAARKIGTVPPKQEIQCGDLTEFTMAIKRMTGSKVVKSSNHLGSFNGIEVRVSPYVPIDKAVVLEDGQVKSIINLRGDI